MINVKIIGYKKPQRYCIKRAVMAAQIELQETNRHLEINMAEIRELSEIQKITHAFMLPSLMINEKLVCVGRFPKKEEIIAWLQEALQAILN